MKGVRYLLVMLGLLCVLLIGCQNAQEAEPNDDEKQNNNNNAQQNDPENEEEDIDASSREALIGTWVGAIEIPEQPLAIQFSFANEDDSDGQMSIPAQGLYDYPFASMDVLTDEVTFVMDIQGQKMTFNGALSEDTMEGTFTQMGESFPFSMVRDASADDASGEFLEIETEMGTLYGELHMPEDVESAPVMLIIPGSGATDRDGNSAAGKNNSLKFIAEALGEQGIASLRFDKRGAGINKEAIGKEEDLQFEQYVTDAVQWLDLLKEDERFEDVGVIGHSEGSLVGMLAAKETDVDGFISLAGTGQPIYETLVDQLDDGQLSDDLLEESKTIVERLKKGEEVEDVSEALFSLFRPSVQPYLISWMQYDPAEELATLDTPTLIVNGTHDIQVSEDEAVILHEANPDTELLIIDDMNHILKEAPADREENMLTYTNPNLPLAEGLMTGIIDFLTTHFKHDDL